MNNVTLTKEMPFEFNGDLRVFTLRCDFVSGNLASKGFPVVDLFANLSGEEVAELKETIDEIRTNHFNDFDKVVDACGGNEGFQYETNYFAQTNTFDVAINLIPVESEYSMKIHFYNKSN